MPRKIRFKQMRPEQLARYFPTEKSKALPLVDIADKAKYNSAVTERDFQRAKNALLDDGLIETEDGLWWRNTRPIEDDKDKKPPAWIPEELDHFLACFPIGEENARDAQEIKNLAINRYLIHDMTIPGLRRELERMKAIHMHNGKWYRKSAFMWTNAEGMIQSSALTPCYLPPFNPAEKNSDILIAASRVRGSLNDFGELIKTLIQTIPTSLALTNRIETHTQEAITPETELFP